MAGETAVMVLAEARAAGFSLSRWQLARWHLAGLIPRPSQRSLGRGSGTETVYPVGTARQLTRLCELHRKERRLNHLAWLLWWEGYRIDDHLARGFIEGVAQKSDQELGRVRVLLGDEKATGDLLEKSARARLPVRLLRQVRRRLAGGRFPQIVELVLHIAAGSFTSYQELNVKPADVEKGLGLDRARTDRLLNVPPWLQKGEEPLRRLSTLMRDASMGRTLAETPDEVLVAARDELRRLLVLLTTFSSVGDRLLGRGAFGLALLGAIQRWCSDEDLARFLSAWLLIRRDPAAAAGTQKILLAGKSLEHVNPADLDVLFKEIPDVAKLMAPARHRRALKSKEAHQLHLEQLQVWADNNRSEMDAFLDRHPDIRERWEAHAAAISK